MAAIQGVELDDESSKEDVLDLKGLSAQHDGFGIDHGLGAITMGEDE